MATLHSPSGFASSEARSQSSGTRTPQTPPYTPHYVRKSQSKRRLERADSPASITSSIHPTETSSPAKKAVKYHFAGKDDVHVEELLDTDPAGFNTEGIEPAELEEVRTEGSEADLWASEETDNDDGKDGASSSSYSSDADISHPFAKLDCLDSDEAGFERQRRAKRRRRRTDSRLFKRSHSQSVKTDLMGSPSLDPDNASGQRNSAKRPRRRGQDELAGEKVMLDEAKTEKVSEDSFGPAPAAAATRTESPTTADVVVRDRRLTPDVSDGTERDDDDDDDNDDDDDDDNDDDDDDDDDADGNEPDDDHDAMEFVWQG